MTPKHESGIYQLLHTPSGHFYLGSTTNLYHRWHSHKTQLSQGKHCQRIQSVHTKISDWNIAIIEPATQNLQDLEISFIQQHISNPLCLNSKLSANSGRRNLKVADSGRYAVASSLLGKNTDKGIRRPANLSFISPDGTVYHNVKSVKRFAEQHNLPQPQMNALANNQLKSVNGWTSANGKLPNIGNIIHYWSEERIRKHYPEYTVVGPDETVYTTFWLAQFEKEHNCTVYTKNIKNGVRSQFNGLNQFGQGYRLNTVDSFAVTYNNVTYSNVISLTKLAETLNIDSTRFRRAITQTVKNKRPYTITRVRA